MDRQSARRKGRRDEIVSAPSVSVLVTTFRHARFVREALNSLVAQTTRDFEVIITDDASDDETPEIVRAWLNERHLPARFIQNRSNRGLCANRNTARALANGEFVCSLSGDDRYEPDRIARQLACFRVLPADVAAVYSDASLIHADGAGAGESFLRKRLGSEPLPDGRQFFRRLLRGNFIPAPAVMARRAAIDAVGGYDESLMIEDWDMWLKLSHRFRFHHVPGALVKYRLLPTSLSHDPALVFARLESAFRTLAPWQGRCGDAEADVAEQLWQLATQAMQLGHLSGARRMMLLAAAANSHRRRHVVAWLVNLPGAFGVVRATHQLYQSALARVLVTPSLAVSDS
jgi:glycosyltransferase involved in cell wall biosynthesis